MADLYTLSLTIDPSGMVTGAARAGTATDALADKTEKLGARTVKGTKEAEAGLTNFANKAKAVGAFVGVAFAASGVFALKAFIDGTKEAQASLAQLEAGLRSTRGVSGQTVNGMLQMSAELQRLTAYSDDAVQRSQALLLTFTRLGGDAFPRATKAIVDMAARMGGDLQGATIMVGKALNDPILGLTALSRAGVTFSDSQEAVIRQLQSTGQTAEAQRIILRELETQFGGSAQAARDTFGGALAGLVNQFGDLFELSRDATGGVVTGINGMTNALATFQEHMSTAASVAKSLFTLLVGGAIASQIPKLIAYNAALAANTVATRTAAAAAVQKAQADLAAATAFQAGAATRLRALAALQAGTTAVTTAEIRLAAANSAVTAASARLATAQSAAAAASGIFAAATNVATTAVARLTAVIAANPLGAFLVGLLAVNAALDYYASRVEKAAAAQEARDIEAVNVVLAKMAERRRKAAEEARKAEEEQARADAARKARQEEEKERLEALTKATIERNAAILKAATDDLRSAQETAAALRVERDIIERTTTARMQGVEASQRLRVALADEAVVREFGGKVMPRVLAELRAETRAREEAAIAAENQNRALDDMIAQHERDAEAAKQTARDKAEAAAQEAEDIAENLTRGMQSAFATFFEDTLTNGLRSFADLFTNIKTLFLRMLSEMLAANMMRTIGAKIKDIIGTPAVEASEGVTGQAATGLFKRFPGVGDKVAGGLAGAGIGAAAGDMLGPVGGAFAGAAGGFAVGGPIGAIVGGVTGLISGLFGQGARARQAAAEMRAATNAWNAALDDFQDIALNGTRTAFENILHGLEEQRDQLAEAAIELLRKDRTSVFDQVRDRGLVGGPLSGNVDEDIAAIERAASRGNISDELRAYLEHLYDVRDAYRENVEAAKAALAEEQKAMDEDLRVRELVALGRHAEAEAMRRQLEYERELQRAREAGLDTTQLERTQAAERDAETRRAAEELAAREAEKRGERAVSAVSSAISQDTASRVLGELVAIRIATRQMADTALGSLPVGTSSTASASLTLAGAPMTFNFYGTETTPETARAFGAEFAIAADRALAQRARERAAHAGRATVRQTTTPGVA